MDSPLVIIHLQNPGSSDTEKKGVTLVALVVTIIVLIILAGVSISLILGNDGIIEKSKNGRNNYVVGANEEEQTSSNVFRYIEDEIDTLAQ